jgi:hypothetical protein
MKGEGLKPMTAVAELYEASLVNPRRRATRAEMAERASFLINYAEAHGPITVRGLYYQAEVHRIPGIGKSDLDYAKIQRQVLILRRCDRLDYQLIADATRWMRKPRSYNSVDEALRSTAALYRKALWGDAPEVVEIWVEKDALAGVILPVTSLYDVPLMVTRGFSSETFCFEAAMARRGDPRPYHVYYFGDFDRSGQDAARTLEEKLRRFARKIGVTVVFETLAVTLDQIINLRLPIRSPKRNSAADRRWRWDFACELDAIPPDTMRTIVQAAIERHLPAAKLDVLKIAEESERTLIRDLVTTIARPSA